jgi:diamine N-acetyltransferase
MARTVKLRKVTADNLQAVAGLELAPDQADLVADNVYSLAESKFDPDARPRAIYAGKRIVGFLMYEIDGCKATIYRFMIDRRHQRRGYGRAAVSEALRKFRSMRGLRTVAISYMPANRPARQFYASLGFREVGLDTDGEMIAKLKL